MESLLKLAPVPPTRLKLLSSDSIELIKFNMICPIHPYSPPSIPHSTHSNPSLGALGIPCSRAQHRRQGIATVIRPQAQQGWWVSAHWGGHGQLVGLWVMTSYDYLLGGFLTYFFQYFWILSLGHPWLGMILEVPPWLRKALYWGDINPSGIIKAETKVTIAGCHTRPSLDHDTSAPM